jgi:hypothetical protein
MQRGGCEFGTKALNAAAANARGVVIIDTGSSPGSGLITMKTVKAAARTLDMLVVSIPNKDGQLLLQSLRSHADTWFHLASAMVCMGIACSLFSNHKLFVSHRLTLLQQLCFRCVKRNKKGGRW